jgi:Flp pilus assembly protein TadG
MPGLYRDRRGQIFVEALFVVPLLFMLFIFIVETGFLMYNWAVINFYTCNCAVAAATRGQFTGDLRLRLARNISDWTVSGRSLNYDVNGTGPPAAPSEDTVYIYGTDSSTQVQRGAYINVNTNYPWHFKLFLIDSLSKFVVSEEDLRLRVNATVPSEVFFE